MQTCAKTTLPPEELGAKSLQRHWPRSRSSPVCSGCPTGHHTPCSPEMTSGLSPEANVPAQHAYGNAEVHGTLVLHVYMERKGVSERSYEKITVLSITGGHCCTPKKAPADPCKSRAPSGSWTSGPTVWTSTERQRQCSDQ